MVSPSQRLGQSGMPMCFTVCPSSISIAIVLLANVVNGADVRMIQSRSGLGLTTETFQGLAILSQIVGKKL
jgi:hypothetical protein